MPLYESVFIARQDIPAQEVENLADSFAAIITDGGGEIAKREYWGLRNLSYRIKKNRKGHYVMFNIEAPAPTVSEMERNMRLSEDILRYMTVRVDEVEEGPSAMLQSRQAREDRPRRDRDRGGDRDRPRDDRPRESRGAEGAEQSAGGE